MFSRDYNELESDLRRQPSSFWVERGQRMALDLFNRASKQVPAYKDFLEKNGVQPQSIKTINDFKKLPLLNKENYISCYELADMCWDGSVTQGSTFAFSSGVATGQPMLWPRFKEQELEAAAIHGVIFDEVFSTYQNPTLFIVCFHLGAHIAGMVTADAIKRLLDEGMPGGLITPGLEKEDIIKSLELIAPNFKQTILIGYPPFLKDIIDICEKTDINCKAINIKFIFSGESFPEAWRQKLLLRTNQEKNIGSINIYGSADLGFMAHETPYTIELRNLAATDATLAGRLGGTTEFVPPVYQYYPGHKFFEEVNNNLVITAPSGLPLIRYDICDRGLLLSSEDMYNYQNRLSPGLVFSKYHLPAVSVLGRSNYAITIYALNIYPEHIRDILNKNELSRIVTGKFFMRTMYDSKEDQYFEIHLETLFEWPSEDVGSTLSEIISTYLMDVNQEYKKLVGAVGSRAWPHIVVYPNNSSDFLSLKGKNRYIIK